MARRVFFSFHYQRDIFRVNTIRKSWVVQGKQEAVFWDASLWESVKLQGADALRRLINDGLNNTSVTAVLIGNETYSRRWVRYEIARSFEQGKGILGVYIHNIKDINKSIDSQGQNPLEYIYYEMNQYRTSINLQEWNGSSWVTYKDLPQISASNIQYRHRIPLTGQLSNFVRVYDWISQSGYTNFGSWVESAAQAAGR